MANQEITKAALAIGLRKVLKTKKLGQITIKDITTECGISRNAFYYHFKDKYDLINWILTSDLLPVINTFSDPDRFFDGFVNLCKYMLKDKQFYMQVFLYDGQNSAQDLLTDTYFELIKIHIATTYCRIGYQLTDEELYVMAKLETHAYVGTILEWIRGGMQDNYISYFEQLKKIKAGLVFPLDIPEMQWGAAEEQSVDPDRKQ